MSTNATSILSAITSADFKLAMPYIALFIGFIYITLTVYAIATSSMLSYYFYTYLALSTIPLFIIFAFVTKIKPNLPAAMAVILMTIIAFIMGIQYLTATYPTAAIIINLMIAILVILIIIIALAIGYNIFVNSLKKMEGIHGFIVNFIFYIPCLFNDFIVYLFNQYKITPNIVFVLIVFEIILILIASYIPYILGKTRSSNGVSILNTPVFLNVKTTQNIDPIATAIHASNGPYIVGALTTALPTYSNNFTISMWIYLNPTDFTSNEITIFEYSQNTGYTTKCTKIDGSTYADARSVCNPVIGTTIYFPKITYKEGTYIIYNGTDAKNTMSFSLIGQTWNYFAFNHNADNTVDVFINGNLERSFDNAYQFNNRTDTPSFKDANNNTVVNNIDHVAVTTSNAAIMNTGQQDGLYGAICNIMYYINPLTAREIITIYNLLMYKNPPLN